MTSNKADWVFAGDLRLTVGQNDGLTQRYDLIDLAIEALHTVLERRFVIPQDVSVHAIGVDQDAVFGVERRDSSGVFSRETVAIRRHQLIDVVPRF